MNGTCIHPTESPPGCVERRAKGRDTQDRDHRWPQHGNPGDEFAPAREELRRREFMGAGGGPGDKIGDPDALLSEEPFICAGEPAGGVVRPVENISRSEIFTYAV